MINSEKSNRFLKPIKFNVSHIIENRTLNFDKVFLIKI